MRHSQTYLDIPILVRLYDAWQNNTLDRVQYWSQYLLACRESQELRDEDHYIGTALSKLLMNLGIAQAEEIVNTSYVTYATAFSLAAKSVECKR